ncbi:hypothetical protein [Pseudarthrobacter sp. ATCC 49987]|uniref:hypothetical protein n=1 Tax=Pseudarthrobacter sp. ATCC 49987 TaxID=2698204 RepID=UPI00136896DC|nr:hypothetical protein [Pseudarthrobacter sp. ATCC 49987]
MTSTATDLSTVTPTDRGLITARHLINDVPDEWADYVRANVEFFEELGSPQGASALGNLGRDHPVVAGEPLPGAVAAAVPVPAP